MKTISHLFLLAAMLGGYESIASHGIILMQAASAADTEDESLPPPLDVPGLLNRLRSDDATVRCQALNELSRGKPIQKPPDALVDAIGHILAHDTEPTARVYACGLLGRWHSPASLEYLRRGVTSKDPQTRASAVSHLSLYGEKAAAAVADIISTLDDESSDEITWVGAPFNLQPVRYFGVNALGDIGPSAKAALPKLVSMLRDDDDPLTRIAAARAVILIGEGDDEALRMLLDELSTDEDEHVVDDIGELPRDASVKRRTKAAMAIADAGRLAKAALPVMLEMYPREKEMIARAMYLSAFANFGVLDPQIVKIAKSELYSDEPALLESAVKALDSQDDLARQAIPELRHLLLAASKRGDQSTIAHIQLRAIALIAKVASVDVAVDVFREKLSQPSADPEVASAIIQRLKSYGPRARNAVPTLRDVLKRHRAAEDEIIEALTEIEEETTTAR